jgi:hypothetical protein
MRRREFLALPAVPLAVQAADATGKTEMAIDGDGFRINGKPTYAGRRYKGLKIEGLLMNSRMIQGIFDDRNPATRGRWAYPDTGEWDAERNTREFVAAMPEWRRYGLLSFSVNLQGGSPEGYSKAQPWDNSAVGPEGELRPAYMARLQRILDRADQLGMAPVVGIFYFGQDQRVRDEAAVRKAVENTVRWILDRGYRHVLLEIDNECNSGAYDHDVLKAARVHELIEMAKGIRVAGRRLLVGTSYGGGRVPLSNVVKASDFLLMHGNGVSDPARITAMVAEVRKIEGYRPMPVVFNEDDHFDFDKPANNMMAAVSSYASWGFFEPGLSNYRDGYQCPPVNWGINTERKKAFFTLLKEVTGV